MIKQIILILILNSTLSADFVKFGSDKYEAITYKSLKRRSVLKKNFVKKHELKDYFNIKFGANKYKTSTYGTLERRSVLKNKFVEELEYNAIIRIKKAISIGDLYDNSSIWISLRHQIPIIPNIRIEQEKLNIVEESTNLDIGLIWKKKEVLKLDSLAVTSLSLTSKDVTAFYNLINNKFLITLDAGITLRNLTVYSKIEDNENNFSVKEELKDKLIPLVYLRTGINIPIPGFTFDIIGKGVVYDGNSFLEYKADLTYRTPFGLGVSLGYLEKKLMTTADSILKVDLNLKGSHMGVNWKF